MSWAKKLQVLWRTCASFRIGMNVFDLKGELGATASFRFGIGVVASRRDARFSFTHVPLKERSLGGSWDVAGCGRGFGSGSGSGSVRMNGFE